MKKLMEYEKFLKKLREARISAGISLRAMGKELGLSCQYISLMERGKCPLRMKDYFAMCEVIGVSPRELMAGENFQKETQETEKALHNLSKHCLEVVKSLAFLMNTQNKDE